VAVEEFPPIMTSDQAATMLQCSRTQVQILARNAIIPANRTPSGRWRFSRDALLKWAAGERAGVPSA